MAVAKKNYFDIIDNKVINGLLICGKSDSSISNQLNVFTDFFKEKKYTINSLAPELLKNQENALVDNFQSFSMFDSNILFILKLRERPNDYTKYIKDLFELNNLNTNNFLIVVADDVSETGSLKKFCSTNSRFEVITCYEEEDKNISNLIRAKLKANGLTFNDEIVEYLTNNIGKNSLFVNNEIEKIALYKGENKNLTIEDVEKCTKNLTEFNIGDLINAFCSFQHNETLQMLYNAKTEDIANVVIIRALIKYFLQLQRMVFRIDSGESVETVIKSERIFWKQVGYTKMHLQKWSLKNINTILEKFIDLEKEAKFSNNILEIENFMVKCFIKFRN